jgi:hypothetical protein
MVFADSFNANRATSTLPAALEGKITSEGHALFNAASSGSLC